MRHGKTGIIITLTSLLLAGAALAQEAPPGNPRDMTPEQREAARAEHRERWENMTDEERQAARENRQEKKKARREERRERWDNMSDEERQAVREKRQAKGDERRHDRHHRQGGERRPQS